MFKIQFCFFRKSILNTAWNNDNFILKYYKKGLVIYKISILFKTNISKYIIL